MATPAHHVVTTFQSKNLHSRPVVENVKTEILYRIGKTFR